MAFVRTKRIGGKPYAYLVENRWEDGRARQTVSKYLGRVEELAAAGPLTHDLSQLDFNAAVSRIIENELAARGFEKGDAGLVNESLAVDTKQWAVTRKGKPACLKINDGFMCSHTLRQLVDFKPLGNEQETGMALARRLVEAGLSVQQETFVALFSRLPKGGN